ncbi:TIGR03085 family metal-binding protein [Pseudonocardia acaciae]|uniref:TIGR03085 family metal-binding protein n=1 Tax=Pseudonocardia acaciae TaxID=551276 RepID=UPI00048D828C|nr:TIGR03085 family metal-binding protein [Pseudonocardia acaciae]
MRLVPAERAALCDLFETTGPDAPTVLPGWDARELLAHLLVRERQPLAAPGILLPPLAGLTERAMRGYDDVPWQRRVEMLRAGPPPWSPYRIGAVDEQANLVEFVVHHEDLARAQPEWRPRPSDPDREEALWSRLRLMARVMYRKSPVGVRLRHPTRERGAEIAARPGRGRVTVTGPPGELILHAFGRGMARVELDGAPADVEALGRTPRGL